MKKTHPAFWGAGWAGAFTGSLLVIVGMTYPADVARMAGGYGLMMIGCAVYLLAGLKLRERIVRRTRPAAAPAPHIATADSHS
ncbi:MAG TPA: hypothetical protein VH987_01845 [Candidatus Limnocylindria bacterium]|jgi:hypothetical protein